MLRSVVIRFLDVAHERIESDALSLFGGFVMMHSSHALGRPAPVAATYPSHAMSLEQLRREASGALDLAIVLRVADVLLFHVEQAHRRGARFPKVHAASITLLPDGSLVLDPSEETHARAPEIPSTENEQTDVLYVGALLFFLLSGVEPRVRLHAPVPALGACRRVASSAVSDLPWHVERAIDPRRAVRWLDVAELREALFGDEGSRRTLPASYARPDWAKAIMDRAHAARNATRR